MVKLAIDIIFSIYLRFAIAIILVLNFLYSSETELKIVVFGHTSDLVHLENINSFINDINSEEPDYVFILGDSDLWRKDIFDIWSSKINSKVFFTPGNHDLFRNRKKVYNNLVGYSDTLMMTKELNFMLINSSASSDEINKFFPVN